MKIKVHFTSYILFLICLVTGFITEILVIFISILIHEIFHAVMSKLYKKNLKSITILPFGGVFEIYDNENVNLIEELMILIAGPFGSFLLMQIEPLYEINKIILIFNLLPIYPLDGGKIIETITCKFVNFKTTLKFTYFLSITISLVLLGYAIKNYSVNFILISLVLISINYKNIRFIQVRYWNFLNDKILYPVKLKTKIHYKLNINSLYRGYNNIFVHKNQFVSEVDLIKNNRKLLYSKRVMTI